jgi:DNA-binding NarL/FixJ family response regulator
MSVKVPGKRKPEGHMINVGIVEDDREVRESLAKLLNVHPQIRSAAACESGEEALQKFCDCRPEVVLMDIKLPGMSGIQCAARLKELLPKTQILMLTAYSDNDNIFEALKAGASGYLLKHVPAAELIQSITAVVEGGAPMTGQIARRVIEAFRKPAPTGPAAAADLTQRETEILQLLARGYANKEIAGQLGISPGTARNHVGHIYEKMHVRCRAEATA